MAHEIGLDAELDVVAVRYSGEITSEEILTVMDECVRLPGFHEGVKAIGDFRDCDVAISAKEISQLATYAKRHDLAWGDTRWALIAAKDSIYGLARIYVAKTNDLNIDTRVFRSNAEADDWLGIGVSLDEAIDRALGAQG